MSAQISASSFRRWLTAASAFALSAALLSGCALYKPEIAQGNFVSREQAAALQPGMTRAQVMQVLGTPLLTDLFRADRWDYVFTLKNRSGVEPQRYNLALFFQGDALQRVEGADSLPTEADFVHFVGDGETYKPRSLEASPEKLQAFSEREQERDLKRVQPERPSAPATTSYPPLPQ